MYFESKDYEKNNYKAKYKQQHYNKLFANIKIDGLNNNMKFGELVFGDMLLNTKKLVEDMVNHYSQFYQNVSLIMLSHHGSKNNGCKDITDYFNYCNIWIDSAGFSNRFSHSSYDLIIDVQDMDKNFFVCNEFVKSIVEG